jgi:hypothetical protein
MYLASVSGYYFANPEAKYFDLVKLQMRPTKKLRANARFMAKMKQQNAGFKFS